MTVKTKIVKEIFHHVFTHEAQLKIVELGGNVDERDVNFQFNDIEIIRNWPSRESAQAWCDYMIAEGVISAEIFED